MKIGLTLGKFSPLHKGHQNVIETALKEMDYLYLMIYDSPETTTIPLTIRAHWIQSLYPEVKIIKAWDGPTEVGYSEEIIKMHDAYISQIMKDKGITHFYSSEPYGEHVSIALNAINRIVDIDRLNYPISGTDIRENPFKFKHYISENVYRDYITNVVFLGAPSTGKSTITEIMAKEFNTVFMPEYGREYWENNQIERRLSPEQLVEIAEGHLTREDEKIFSANNFLFTDTNVLTTRIFSIYYHGKAHIKLDELANLHSNRYDIYFLCDTDIPYDDTWDRSGIGNRNVMQKQIIADLHCRKIPYILLKGSIEDRKETVKSVLKSYKKYTNFWGNFLMS